MPSPNEPVQPTPFDVVQPTATAAPAPVAAARQRSASWVVPALVALLLVAVLVIFWLPGRVAETPSATPQESSQQAGAQQNGAVQGAANSAPDAPTPAASEATPWSDAQLARLRKAAQDVLAQLLDVQFALQEAAVEQWAAQRFAEAGTRAAAGDELYKNREFEAASAEYGHALELLQALQDSLPDALAQLLEQARQAIESGDAGAAGRALDTAAMMNPDADGLAALQQRLQVLPQLLPLLEEAGAAETESDLASAQQLLQQATALDPQHLRARDELQRVTAAARDKAFNEAMSEGYTALDDRRFDTARKAFRNAAELQPGSSEANSALLEVEAAQTAYRLAALNDKGRQNEQGERWQQAVESYEQAQKIDASVLFASEGLSRSRARAQLDQQFKTVIAKPGRLSDAAVAENAAQLLQQAREITPRGPVLQGQIDSLETLLRQASTPVTVTLLSDMETEVTVYKVKRLGRFSERQLTLRPGTYTAVGSRNGYRDVRLDITIAHDEIPAAVTIVCTEPI